MSAAGLRLFVAIDPPKRIAAALEEAIAPVRRLAPDERWSQLSNLHLTLAFLGHLPPDALEPIGAALARATAAHPAFTVRVRGAGSFGRGARARVLWVGVEGGDELLRLQASVADGLAVVGYREERPFRPHLTLARARTPRGSRALADARDALAGLDFGAFPADALILYRSETGPGGSRYSALSTFPLARR